jgi:hypothetical protein
MSNLALSLRLLAAEEGLVPKAVVGLVLREKIRMRNEEGWRFLIRIHVGKQCFVGIVWLLVCV